MPASVADVIRSRGSSWRPFVDEYDRVLLVEPTYKSYWDVPGGYVEPGESPLAACIREVQRNLVSRRP